MKWRGSHWAAVEAYRRGHDRVWDVERMRGRPPESPEPVRELEWSGRPKAPSFGVAVPPVLDYHRGPDDWRDGERPAPESRRND